jgi:hypothetical protein
MIRMLSLALIALVLMGLPAFAADSGRISGHVLEVKDGGQTLVLLEQGPWYGPSTGLFKRTITLAPGTSVRLVRPTGEWTNDSSPGYEAQPMDLKDLKPGMLVTVLGGPGRAASIEVPHPGEVGQAAPRVIIETGK